MSTLPTKKTLRTTHTEAIYQDHMFHNPEAPCHLDNIDPSKIIKEWDDCLISENDFPYDGVFTTSHVFSLKLHTADSLLLYVARTRIEVAEYIDNNYDYILENTKSGQSIPDHTHIHLLNR